MDKAPDSYKEDSHNWNGSQHDAYRRTAEWYERCEKVHERDKTCRLCHGTRKLVVHHLQHWIPLESDPTYYVNEWAYDGSDDPDPDKIGTLVLLCNTCHRYLVHKDHVPEIQDVVNKLINNF